MYHSCHVFDAICQGCLRLHQTCPKYRSFAEFVRNNIKHHYFFLRQLSVFLQPGSDLEYLTVQTKHPQLPITLLNMAEVAMPQPPPSLGNDENLAPSTENGASSDEIKTVFHDVNNFNVKHPLMNTWSLWVCR